MFDFVHNNKKVIQIFLALIILPFAFWGVDSYRKSGGGEALATVNGEKISQQEFDNAMRQQQDRLRGMMGDKFDPAMFDRPEVRRSILENLINQRLLSSQAQAAGLTVSDEQLAQVIAGVEAFRADGKFDKQRYEEVLRRQNLTPLMFEERVQRELGTRQLTDAYTSNGYASATVAERLVRLNEQQRTVSIARIPVEAFSKQVKLDDVAIKEYYDKNPAEFRQPEQVRVEYATFSVEALLPQVTVDEAEIKGYYDEHQQEFGTLEQRHAAHILIAASATSPDADKQAAKARAEQVLQQVRLAPAKFAELAKQHSQDPGSAANGGDLGTFGRGMMVKPFEDATFQLKPGEVSGVVQSDFGYHIIKLLGIVPARLQPLAEVRNAIVQNLKQQKAGEKFAELAEKFSNAVYEQSDTLKPAAELVKVPVQQSAWLTKGQAAVPPWTDKALQAAFSDEVIKDKRNSAAVEVGSNVLMSVRMLEHKPASARPLAEVSGAIRESLTRKQALELAVKQGQALLAQLQKGESPKLEWKAAQVITHAQAAGLGGELVSQIFRADTAQLPAYAGAENAQDGYVLARVEAVKDVTAVDEAKRARYMQQMRQFTGEDMLQAYMADARKRADINIRATAEVEQK